MVFAFCKLNYFPLDTAYPILRDTGPCMLYLYWRSGVEYSRCSLKALQEEGAPRRRNNRREEVLYS
jgi:hypothetical protein